AEHKQLGARALQHDLGPLVLFAGLILPSSGLQKTLNQDAIPLGEIFLGDTSEAFREDDDAMPLRLFLLLAILRFPTFARGDPKPHNGLARLRVSCLWLGAEIADNGRSIQTCWHVI